MEVSTRRFVAELLREAEKSVRPALHKFLVSVVEGTAGGELKAEHHILLFQASRSPGLALQMQLETVRA